MSKTITVILYVERNGASDIPVDVNVCLEYDRGEYLESGHAMNGYGAGYETYVDKYKCEEVPNIELTAEEEETACEMAIEAISEC